MADKLSSLIKADVVNKSGFYSLGGSLAVDFSNSLWRLPDGGEGLSSFEDLMLFLKSMGHLNEEAASEYHMYVFQAPRRCHDVLSEAIKLRAVIRDLLSALEAKRPLEDEKLNYVNAQLADQASYQQIGENAKGPALNQHMLEKGPQALLAPILSDVARLLTSPSRQKIRQCAAGDCQLFFINNSRNGRRRWCAMSTCGNRSKVRAFLDRKSP